jgi:RHS repeat-associated protein
MPASGSTINVLTACKYPNGTAYQFSYSPWGIVNRIDQLSSAATTTIRSYESYNFPDTAQPLSDAPAYTTMTVSRDGTSTSSWTYAVTKNGQGQVTSQVTTDQLGTVSTVNLNTDGSLASTQVKDSTGKIFRTVSFTWNGSLVSSITTTDDAGNHSSISYAYDGNGNITDQKEFDFSGNNPVRESVISYMGAPFTGSHILNLVQSIQIKDGSGALKSRIDFNYDEGTRNPLSPFPLQNDGSTNAPRGNLTSITRYPMLSDLTQKTIRSMTYDAAGNLVVAQVDCCNQKKFNFNSSTQYAYLSSVVRGPDGGLQFTTGFNFNVDNGLMQSITGENNQQTSFQYDNIYRLIHVTPPAPAGAQTIQYADDALAPQMTTTTTANSSKSIQTFDGLGHLTQQQLVDVSTGNATSTTQYQYDLIWRRTGTSNPYAGSEAVAFNNVAYDALNRTVSITPPSGGSKTFTFSGNTVLISDPAGKQRKNFYDGLGRLVRVDELGCGDALTAIDSISVSGSERSKIISTRYCAQYTFSNPPRCVDWEFNSETIYDQGNVTATINGVGYTQPYGASDSSGTISTNLAAKINNDPNRTVNSAPSGSTISLYAVTPGAVGNNISVSISSSTTDTADFGAGTTSFPASTFTPTLTAGENALSQENAVLTATRHITTTYGYDVFDQLVSVSHGAMDHVNGGSLSGQPRSYAYDDLRRLTSVTTPESGTVTNYYTNSLGNACSGDPSLICRVRDARGITKTFTYNDPFNRLTGVAYDDGSTPPVSYAYDVGGQAAFALGRLTRVTEDISGAGNPNAETFTYDNLGRVTSVTHTISGTNYPVGFGYNSMGQITSTTYPSGRVVQPAYDGVGRLTQVVDAVGPTSYLSINSTDYSGAGEIRKLLLGNGIIGQFSFNDHLQLSTIRYYNPNAGTGAPDVLNLSYDYTGAAQQNNNGEIQAVHYYTLPGTEDTTKSESFTYDAWSRLRQAQTLNSTAPNTWNLNWTYDRLGNRLTQSGSGTASVPQPAFMMDSNTNHIIGYCYDLAGNILDEGSCPTGTHKYTYDGANRLTAINGNAATYVYFGPLRIKKTNGDGTTIYIYSGNRPIAEYAPGAPLASPLKEYVYAGSQLLASVAGTSTTYYHPDHLSNRAETNASGTVTRQLGNFPYGEPWYDNTPAEKWQFTNYEHDIGAGETGLHYATFRHYNAGQGRFMQPDLMGGNPNAPQSLNRYSYVANDPINLIDPLGLYCAIWELDFARVHGSNDSWTFMGSTCVLEIPDGGFSGGGGGGNGGGGGPGDKARQDALDRLKNKLCMDWILKTLAKAYEVLNNQTRASGYGVSPEVKQAQADASTEKRFTNVVANTKIENATNPKPEDYASVAQGSNVIKLEGAWKDDPDQAGTIIHEMFHVDGPYGFSDETMAKSLNASYKVVPNDPDTTRDNASVAWNKKLEDSPCGKDKQKK